MQVLLPYKITPKKKKKKVQILQICTFLSKLLNCLEKKGESLGCPRLRKTLWHLNLSFH